jgi:hypothetical protein
MPGGSYTLSKRAVHDKTLTPNQADTILVQTGEDGGQGSVEVLSDGSFDVYVSVDGTAATISGPNTRKIPAAFPSSLTIPVEYDASGSATVSLISAGAAKYSVTRESV